MTDVTLEVESSLKGSASGRTVVTIPGGRVGSTLYEVSDMPVFIEGEEVVVFVWRGANGVSTVTGGVLGKLTVFDDKANNSRMVMGAGQLLDPGDTVNRIGDTTSDTTTLVRISLDDFKRKIAGLGEK